MHSREAAALLTLWGVQETDCGTRRPLCFHVLRTKGLGVCVHTGSPRWVWGCWSVLYPVPWARTGLLPARGIRVQGPPAALTQNSLQEPIQGSACVLPPRHCHLLLKIPKCVGDPGCLGSFGFHFGPKFVVA